MFDDFRPVRGRGRGRDARLPENVFENAPVPPRDRLEDIFQAIQQQNALLLQVLQNGQAPQAVPPPARKNNVPNQYPAKGQAAHNEQNEPAADMQGPELPPPPPLRPQRNILPEFIKWNRYFEGLPGKPEEAEDWLAQIERSFDVF